jgi:preprotein translocase subunit SecG
MSGFVVALVTTLHIVICAALMMAILLQSGKGGGLAGAFGAGSSQTLFGGRGAATFLSRTTTVLATLFFLTSLTLGLAASRAGRAERSLIGEEARQRGQQRAAQQGAGAPTTPATPPQAAPGAAPGQTPVQAPTGPAPTSPAPPGGAGN